MNSLIDHIEHDVNRRDELSTIGSRSNERKASFLRRYGRQN